MCDDCRPDSLWNKAKLMVGCLEECKAFAIEMGWLSEGGEIEDDAPGWVSLLVHSIPDDIPAGG